MREKVSQINHSHVRLSMIVPCYQVEPYLPKCLDSLLNQSLTGIEIICINDGSPDNSLAILKDYQQRHPGRIILIDKPNEGVWKARKDGIAAATGEYIGFLDSDDYLHPDFAKKLYEAAVSKNADIACCGFHRIDLETGETFSTEMTSFRQEYFDIQKEPGLMLEVNTAIWNKIYRAGIIKAMGDIPKVPKALDDVMFTQLIHINAKNITFVKEPLIYYMVRRVSIINNIKQEYIPDIYAAMTDVRRIYEQKNPGMLTLLDAEAFLNLGISLMFRLYGEKNFSSILQTNTDFLDKEFPGWRKNPYITLSYVLRHNGCNAKVWIVRGFYRLHLFRFFLFVYRMMIDRLKKDIKW